MNNILYWILFSFSMGKKHYEWNQNLYRSIFNLHDVYFYFDLAWYHGVECRLLSVDYIQYIGTGYVLCIHQLLTHFIRTCQISREESNDLRLIFLPFNSHYIVCFISDSPLPFNKLIIIILYAPGYFHISISSKLYKDHSEKNQKLLYAIYIRPTSFYVWFTPSAHYQQWNNLCMFSRSSLTG